MRAASPTRLACGTTLVVLVALLAEHASSRAAAASAPAPAAFLVIVHPSNRVESLDRSFVASMFLRKTTRWPSGTSIEPVDQAPGSRTRARFSLDVIGRSVASIRSYWQQIIFAGRGLPPPELADEEAIVRYVLEHPGAIGYVSATMTVRAARVVAVR